MYWWLFIKYIVSVFSESTSSRSWNAVSIRVFVQKHCEIWSWYSALTFIKCFWGDFFFKKWDMYLCKNISVLFLRACLPDHRHKNAILQFIFTHDDHQTCYSLISLFPLHFLPSLSFFFLYISFFFYTTANYFHHFYLSDIYKWG